MVAGDKRRSAENLEAKSLGYFNEICLRATNTRDSCLVALLFLSGRRISELLPLKKSDVQNTDEFLTIKTFNEKTFKYTQTKDFKIVKEGHYFQYLKDEQGQTKQVPKTERYYPEIFITISKSTLAYQTLGGFVTQHLDTLRNSDYLFGRLKGEGYIGRQMAYKIVTFLEPDVWPHWFRHQRFTQVYNIVKSTVKDPFDVLLVLHDFTKHTRLDTTMNYVHHLKLQEVKKEI